MPDSHFLPVGRIRKAHGIRGEVSVEYHADSPALLRGGAYMRRGRETPVLYEVETTRFHHGALLVKFAAVPDRTVAETMRGCEILVPEECLPPPGDDEIYLYQLLGMTVVAVDDHGGETVWGTIESVIEPAGQEIWTICMDGEEDVLFPATPELVIGFDLEERVARIAPPPGLLELYRF